MIYFIQLYMLFNKFDRNLECIILSTVLESYHLFAYEF